MDKNVITYVSSGGIMEKPDNCPDIIYDCMKLCWRFKASERPTFAEIVKMFLPCARSDFAQTSFFHNELQSETQRLDRSVFANFFLKKLKYKHSNSNIRAANNVPPINNKNADKNCSKAKGSLVAF